MRVNVYAEEMTDRYWLSLVFLGLIFGPSVASARYKVTDWARNRQGSYVDARVNKQFPLRKEQDNAR